MALSIKTLQTGSITAAASQTNIYTVTSPALSSIITSIRIVNEDPAGSPATAKVTLYARRNAPADIRRITKKDITVTVSGATGLFLVDDVVTLSVNDSIAIDVALTGGPTTTKITYALEGAETV